MASNSKFSATLEHGSDLVYVYSCLSCSEDGRNSEANNFCQDCSQCFCDLCITHHNKVMTGHAVLGRNDVDNWSMDVNCKGGEKPLPGPDHVFEVEKHVLHNVKLDDDKHTCGITGICVLADGEFLLSDSENSKLKLLNSSYRVISTSNVQDGPWGICSTGQREAAVVVDNDDKNRHEILLVRVKAGKIEQIRTIKLQHKCAGLDHHGGQLYVTTNRVLHVYDMAGDQDRQLYCGQIGSFTVSSSAVSPDGTHIFITNYTHHQLITLNKDGTKLSTLCHPELLRPLQVLVTSQGRVFVCCTYHGTVVQVVKKNNQQTVTTLAGKNNGLTSPRTLCFNSNSSLIVGQLNNDNIVELKLK